MSNIVEVKDLKVYFDIHRGLIEDIFSKETLQVKAVDGIDLCIKKGEILSLVGESGSGKTTTGKAILQLIERKQGEIIFDGLPTNLKDKEWVKKFRQRAQMIFQDPYESLNPKDMIIDIVAEPLDVNDLVKTSKDRKEKVIQALEWSGLKPGIDYLYRYPHELSGGQRQRVAIAGALILEPSFIVADEPVSMLDVSIRADILRLMMDMREKKNISYLFITHDLSLAWLISDRIAIMYLGKIVEIGSSELIVGNCLHPYSKALISVMPVPSVKHKKERIILKGDTPNPTHIPSGCRFHPRCPSAMDICMVEIPMLKELETGHFVACHLY